MEEAGRERTTRAVIRNSRDGIETLARLTVAKGIDAQGVLVMYDSAQILKIPPNVLMKSWVFRQILHERAEPTFSSIFIRIVLKFQIDEN